MRFSSGTLFLGSASGLSDNNLMMFRPFAFRQDENTSHSDSDSDPGTAAEEQVAEVPLTFDQVYEENFSFVWRVVKRQGIAPQHVDDVCQEVFLIVHRKLGEFEQRAKVRTWIYQIITNVVRNQHRSIQRKSPHARSQGEVLDPDDLDGRTVSPEANTANRQAAGVAREILLGMNDAHRMVFVLVELEDMSLRDVAEATGESFHTVRSRLRTARLEFERHARRARNMAEWGGHG